MIREQLLIATLALLGWAAFGDATTLTLVCAYLASWLLVGTTRAAKGPRLAQAPVWLFGFLFLGSAAAAIATHGPRLLIREHLHGLTPRTTDRLRLERSPAVFPAVVFDDHPQRFYVGAAPRASVTVTMGREELPAWPLGAGIYRVDYDPKTHGAPRTEIAVSVNGSVDRREVTVIHRGAHPRRFDSTSEIAVTTSRETDELIALKQDGALLRIPVGDGPIDAVIAKNGESALVIHAHDSPVWVDLGTSQTTVGPALGQPTSVTYRALSHNEGLFAAASGGTGDAAPSVVIATLQTNGTKLENEQRVSLPGDADWIAFDGADRLALAIRRTRSIHVVDRGDAGWSLSDDVIKLGRPVVGASRRIVDGHWAVSTTGYDAQGKMLGGNHFADDRVLSIDIAKRRVVMNLPTLRDLNGAPAGPATESEQAVVSGGSPIGLTWHHGEPAVTFAGTDEIKLGPGLDTSIRLGSTPLFAPHGIARLGKAWAISSPAAGAVALIDDTGAMLAHHAMRETTEAEHAQRRGERAYYETTREGLSCQTCHLHGGDDFCLHDLTPHGVAPQPPRPTLSTEGVAMTAPYLRDGSFPVLGDLNTVAISRYRGYPREADSDRAADLSAFVTAQPLRTALRSGAESDQFKAGMRAFVQAGCNTCHAGPAFSNLGQHAAVSLFPTPVKASGRSGEMLDTPSLVGVSRRAYFLSDGRARSLAEVIGDHNPDNLHGDTQRLSQQERADLLFLLESL